MSHLISNVKLKAATLISAVFVMLFLVSGTLAPLKLEPVILHPQLLSITPKEFYIAKVVDERLDKKAVAWIFPPPVLKQKSVLQTVDLQGGGLNAIQSFISESFPQDKKLRPILVHLKECKVTELQSTSGRIEGKVAFALSFSLLAGEEPVYLTDYRMDTKYNRSENQLNMIEPILSESILSALKYFNTWMDNQADHNPKLATIVKVDFKNYQEKLEGDTVYYSSNRLLTWTDFQDKPRTGKYAAVVFPSFGFEEHREVVKSEIRLHLEMKVYVPKSACWVKDGDRNDYTLNHEQRHFDLVAIVGKHFEQKVKTAKLPVNNCDGLINVEYYESFREMNHLQDQYDDETQHGINTLAQERWNKKIDQDLIKLGIKPTS